MVDEFDEEEEIRLPKKKKNEKKGSRATIDSDTTLGKRKKKSKWWENFSIDEENPAFASCFIEFCKALNPLFRLPSRTTTTRDCYTLFIEQRNELKVSFKNLHSRVFLTTDT
ncbi:hypothetical protein V6N13_109799 [Hibiscus sabdariffa]